AAPTATPLPYPTLFRSSVLDGLDALPLELLQMVPHGLELLGRVPLPVRDFARDPQRVPRAVGLRRVARVLLVRQVGVVLDGAGRLHDVDPAAPFADGQFGPPGG